MTTQLSSRTPLVCALLTGGLLGIGCDDSLKRVSLIEETRVLGARVEVRGDATRSSPQSGESAQLRFFLAAPSGQPSAAYALSVCAVRLTNSGFPRCAGEPFAIGVRAEASSGAPSVDFDVPTDLDLSATPHGFASGLLCPESALHLGSAGEASCEGSAGSEVAFEFDLGSAEHENRSPTFDAASLTLDGAAWPASEAARCPGDLPEVSGKSSHRLRVTLGDTAFELLPQENDLDPAREALLVSHFSSAGELKHAFTSLSAETPPAQREVTWVAPAVAVAAPLLTRFYFVVRDARGGEDFATRALCVVP